MVAQHLFPRQATSEQTLDVLWRSTAERTSLRGGVLLLALGLAGVAVRATTGRFTILASVGIGITAFACYAMLTQLRRAEPGTHPRAARLVGGAMTMAAAMAAVATALLILAAVFGSSIEVMRH